VKACPKCGGTKGYSLRVRALGYTIHEGTWDGMHEFIASDSELKFVGDKTVKCLDCNRRTLLKTIRAAA
jgi:hypothetical protein